MARRVYPVWRQRLRWIVFDAAFINPRPMVPVRGTAGSQPFISKGINAQLKSAVCVIDWPSIRTYYITSLTSQ